MHSPCWSKQQSYVYSSSTKDSFHSRSRCLTASRHVQSTDFVGYSVRMSNDLMSRIKRCLLGRLGQCVSCMAVLHGSSIDCFPIPSADPESAVHGTCAASRVLHSKGLACALADGHQMLQGSEGPASSKRCRREQSNQHVTDPVSMKHPARQGTCPMSSKAGINSSIGLHRNRQVGADPDTSSFLAVEHDPQGAHGHEPEGAKGHEPQGAEGHEPQGVDGHEPPGAKGRDPFGARRTSKGAERRPPRLQSLLMRLIDDFLFITPSQTAAEALVNKLLKGVLPHYNAGLPHLVISIWHKVEDQKLTHLQTRDGRRARCDFNRLLSRPTAGSGTHLHR